MDEGPFIYKVFTNIQFTALWPGVNRIIVKQISEFCDATRYLSPSSFLGGVPTVRG